MLALSHLGILVLLAKASILSAVDLLILKSCCHVLLTSKELASRNWGILANTRYICVCVRNSYRDAKSSASLTQLYVLVFASLQ